MSLLMALAAQEHIADGELLTFKVDIKKSKICENSIWHTKADSFKDDDVDYYYWCLVVFVAAAILMSQYVHEWRQVKAVNGRAQNLYRILLLVCNCRTPLGVLMFPSPVVCVAKSVGRGCWWWWLCVKVEQGGAILWRCRVATLCSKLVAPIDGCVVGINKRTSSRPLLQPAVADTLPTCFTCLLVARDVQTK